MENWFAVDHLDVERLLAEWRWMCPGQMTLIARNVFADLFLRDESGAVFRLNAAIGKLTPVADSEACFRELATSEQMREEWFAETDERAAAARGLQPSTTECIGFTTPLVFAESGFPNPPYVVDLYEHVSFLGDLHHQLADVPDGGKVRLVIKKP